MEDFAKEYDRQRALEADGNVVQLNPRIELLESSAYEQRNMNTAQEETHHIARSSSCMQKKLWTPASFSGCGKRVTQLPGLAEQRDVREADDHFERTRSRSVNKQAGRINKLEDDWPEGMFPLDENDDY